MAGGLTFSPPPSVCRCRTLPPEVMVRGWGVLPPPEVIGQRWGQLRELQVRRRSPGHAVSVLIPWPCPHPEAVTQRGLTRATLTADPSPEPEEVVPCGLQGAPSLVFPCSRHHRLCSLSHQHLGNRGTPAQVGSGVLGLWTPALRVEAVPSPLAEPARSLRMWCPRAESSLSSFCSGPAFVISWRSRRLFQKGPWARCPGSSSPHLGLGDPGRKKHPLERELMACFLLSS